MRRTSFICFFVIMFLNLTWETSGQFFSTCQCGSREELEASIKSHNDHIYRLQRKFTDIYYFQGRIPNDVLKADLGMIINYLRELKPRRAAVIFYAYQPKRLCTWLISPNLKNTDFISSAGDVDDMEFVRLCEAFKEAIGVSKNNPQRIMTPMPPSTKEPSMVVKVPPSADYVKIIDRLSQMLLPEPITDGLREAKIDTLVVVPISLRYYVEGIDKLNAAPEDSAHVASIGSIPFAALKLKNKMLIDEMSVVVAPGFFVFAQGPLRINRPNGFRHPIVVGDPTVKNSGYSFTELPGARAEAIAIANELGIEAIVGPAATRCNVIPRVRPATDLICLATHGFADERNPRDSSFLVLSDGLWRANEIQHLELKSRPLVILSACQTALGKDFDVGTIGLARTWQWAGASNVVMSLWNIYDEFASEFMPIFMKLATHMPPEEALRQVMLQIRGRAKYSNPKYWAGYTVYGAPHIIY
jgi:CHAT domain-containing protein